MNKKSSVLLSLFVSMAIVSFGQAPPPAAPPFTPPPPALPPPFVEQPVAAIPVGGGGGPVSTPAISPLPTSLPIQNQGVLKAFALSQAVSADLFISSSAMTGRGYVEHVFSVNYFADKSRLVQGGNVDTLLDQVRTFTPRFQVTRGDPVDVNLTLRNPDGYYLFSGYQSSLVSYMSGQFRFNAIVELNIADTIPIPYNGAEEARIVVRRSNGDVIRNQPLHVSDGYIFYPFAGAERPGELIVNGRNIPEQVFDIATGGLRPTSSVAGGVGVSIKGVYEFGVNPQNAGLFAVENIRAAIVHYEVRDDVKGGAPDVLLDAQSTTGERAIGFLIRNRAAAPTEPWQFHQINRQTPFWGFPQGRYEVVYVLSLSDLDGVPVIFPDDGREG